MIQISIYDIATGRIMVFAGVADAATAELMLQAGQGYVEGRWLAEDYAVIDGEPVSRTALEVAPDRLRILADGLDTATLAGLPEDARVMVGGVVTEPVEGVVEITATEGADIEVEVVGAYQAGPWVISAKSLASFQDEVWHKAKAKRTDVVNGGCLTPFGHVQTDIDSRINISGEAQMATMAKSAGAPYETTWTMTDDAEVDLDADEMIELGLAVGDLVRGCHERGRSLRSAIYSSTDLATLFSIDIDMGWPE